MAIFNSYVSLPEGIFTIAGWLMKNPWYTTHGWLRSKELGQFSGHVVARRARARLTQLVHLAPWRI
jgi:hypothetical protein